MWIVRNVLRGDLRFSRLELVIPAREEVDLDRALGREQAEGAEEIRIAFDEGYLQNVRKDEPAAAGAISPQDLGKHLDRFKRSIMREIRASLPADLMGGDQMRAELRELQESVVGGMRDLLEKVRFRLREERMRVVEDQTLGEAEMRARLRFLEEKERELDANFERLGREGDSGPEPSQLIRHAELLGGMSSASPAGGHQKEVS